jgi:hypothetical protein
MLGVVMLTVMQSVAFCYTKCQYVEYPISIDILGVVWPSVIIVSVAAPFKKLPLSFEASKNIFHQNFFSNKRINFCFNDMPDTDTVTGTAIQHIKYIIYY